MEYGEDHGSLTWEEYGLLLHYCTTGSWIRPSRRASGGWWRTSRCWTGCCPGSG